MYIVNNKYKVVKRLSDNAFIPMNEKNSDYQEYLTWIEEGNTPEISEEV